MPTASADWLKVLMAAGATDTTPTQRPTADLPPGRGKLARREIGREIAPQSEIPVPVTLTVGPIPVRLVSEANRGGKLRERIARKTAVKEAVKAALPTIKLPLPLELLGSRFSRRLNHARPLVVLIVPSMSAEVALFSSCWPLDPPETDRSRPFFVSSSII